MGVSKKVDVVCILRVNEDVLSTPLWEFLKQAWKEGKISNEQFSFYSLMGVSWSLTCWTGLLLGCATRSFYSLMGVSQL